MGFAVGETCLYCYVANDPVNFYDPNGRFVMTAAAGLALGLVIGPIIGPPIGYLIGEIRDAFRDPLPDEYDWPYDPSEIPPFDPSDYLRDPSNERIGAFCPGDDAPSQLPGPRLRDPLDPFPNFPNHPDTEQQVYVLPNPVRVPVR
jgi:hypothetical protein